MPVSRDEKRRWPIEGRSAEPPSGLDGGERMLFRCMQRLYSHMGCTPSNLEVKVSLQHQAVTPTNHSGVKANFHFRSLGQIQ